MLSVKISRARQITRRSTCGDRNFPGAAGATRAGDATPTLRRPPIKQLARSPLLLPGRLSSYLKLISFRTRIEQRDTLTAVPFALCSRARANNLQTDPARARYVT